jgi:hypothetical protein
MQTSDTLAISGDRDLQVRIRAEYQEMPGLRLTLTQAARLFNLEPERCARVLAGLVEHGTLSVAAGSFVRGSA